MTSVINKPNPKFVITPSSNEDETAAENDLEIQNENLKKESAVDEIGKRKVILNIDSLLNEYKQQAVDQNSNDGKCDFENDSDEDDEKELINEKLKGIFRPRHEQTKEKKVKSVTIKNKHQQARESKTSKILMPVLKVDAYFVEEKHINKPA